MPYIEDRGGIDLCGKDPWKGYPVAIVERMLTIVGKNVGLPVDKLLPGSRIVEDLGQDSLDIEELFLAVEQGFGLPEVPDADAVRIETVGDFVQYVKDRTG